MVDAATRAMGLRTLAEELGVECKIVLHMDSSGAKSMASRRGVGKVRHIETKWLWLQAAVAEGRITLKKVHGEDNIADLMAKYFGKDKILKVLEAMGLTATGGSPHAPGDGRHS